MADSERIARLEQLVRALHDDVAALRADVAFLRGAPADAAPKAPAPLPPAPAAARPPEPASARPPEPAAVRPPGLVAPALDLEAIIGRYGTIALAVVAILVGAGAFLTWAIAHGLLGPVSRVVLGAVAAALVALAGWRLRARGIVRFGNVVIALALALLELDMWAAGPRLHLVPAGATLAVTFIASEALALFALRAEEEPLFAVGLGGALLAPFVAAGAGSPYALAAYGFLVIASGVFGLRSDDWRMTTALLVVAGLVYAVALGGQAVAHGAAERAVAPAFALACAWNVLIWGRTRARSGLALFFLLVSAVSLVGSTSFVTARSLGAELLVPIVVLGVAGVLTSYAALWRLDRSPPWRAAAGIALPLAFLLGVEVALEYAERRYGVLVAAGWTVLALAAAVAARRDRGPHLVTAAGASALAVLLALHRSPEYCVVALAVHAAVFAWLLGALRVRALAWPVALVLGLASLWAERLLLERTAFGYVPFATRASAAALAVTLSWGAFAHAMRVTAGAADAGGPAGVQRASRWILPAVAAFCWILTELSQAFSPAIAVFLSIVFLAASGVGLIFYGKRRAWRAARLAGLALAYYAGIRAVVQAWSFDAVGLRVGSCILVGLFVALVAYWYRDRGSEGERAVRSPA